MDLPGSRDDAADVCGSCSGSSASAELLTAAQACSRAVPEQRDALLFTAIAQRFLGRIPEALADPGHPGTAAPALQSSLRGAWALLVAHAPGAPAIEAFLKAVQHQPRAAGQLGHARRAVSHAGRRQNAATGGEPRGDLARACRRRWWSRPACLPMAIWSPPRR